MLSSDSPIDPIPRQRSLFRTFHLQALQRVGLALTIGTLSAWLAPANFRDATRGVTAWDGFCLAMLIMIWASIATADVAHMRRLATTQDPGRTGTFIAVLLAAGASLFAVALLLHGLHSLSWPARTVQIIVSALAVLGSWLLVHTLFTLRYAHAYFRIDQSTNPPEMMGGLYFSGGNIPTSYWDFAYYSFTIGMTAQTSDTNVTTRQMRRLTLAHGILSFGFNTAIIALGVNVLASIL